MDTNTPVDLRLESFSTVQIVGSSNSGKTTLSLRLALEHEKVFRQPHEKVIYFYKYYQNAFKNVHEEGEGDIIFLGDKEEVDAELEEGVPTLVIADDFLLEACHKQNKYVTSFFTERSHHCKTTFVFQSQLLYPKNGRAWSLNTSYYCLFRTFHQRQIVDFLRNLNPRQAKFLYDAFTHSTEEKKFSHFFMSLHPKTEDHLRYRSSIIPDENVEIFVPKQHAAGRE